MAVYVSVRPPVTVPYWILSFSMVTLAYGLVPLVYHIMINPFVLSLVSDAAFNALPFVFSWILFQLPITEQPPAPNVAGSSQAPSSSLSCPEDDVTLWEWCTFQFVEPIFKLASKRTLHDTDVWLLSPYLRHRNLFQKYLKYRSQYWASRNPTHSILWFLLVSNFLDLFLDLALELWSATVGFLPPYALKEILASLSENTPASREKAYFWTLAIFLAHLSFAQVDLFQRWHVRRCYERTRGQLFCAIHYKALLRQDLSGKTAGEGKVEDAADLGKVVNLMQGDAYAVSLRFWQFSALFMAPVRLIIALGLLYHVLGWSSLFGVLMVVIAYVFNYPLAKYKIKLTRGSWKAKDKRMNIVNELLQNIRFLKFYGWERHWRNTALGSREEELAWRVKENIVDTFISFIWIWMPSATALASFLSYTLIFGGSLTVSKAFTALALFSQLQGPMVQLPSQIFGLLHAYVSMQRINAFLAEDEVTDRATTLRHPTNNASPQKKEIGFRDDAKFRWYGNGRDVAPGEFELGPLNVSVPPGQLTLITGATGSGKTALLSSLLGETECVSGAALLDKKGHKVAYCGQTPWLEHATIRENITYSTSAGSDEARYQAVIFACSLAADLAMFDAGDATEIGEKGITLSGGQRARIALARAMYSQAECILLDDPLAAVDMHTAQHLVEHCLSGSLAQGRTIILVTHHISLCVPVAAYVVELSAGRVLRQGSIKEFEATGVLEKVIEVEDIQASDGDAALDEIPAPEEVDATNEADALRAPELGTEASRNKTDGKLVKAEARAEGRVTLHTYATYVKAAGVMAWILTLSLMLLIRALDIGNQVFLSKWGEAYEQERPANEPSLTVNGLDLDLPPPEADVKPWLMIYLFISLAGAFSMLIYIGLGYYASLQASRKLFVALTRNLTRAPARFFDVTPIGRILNRFTTDINTVDGALQESSRSALLGVLNFVASFGVILFFVPAFAPFALFIAWLYVRLAPPYINASRDLRRLESVSLSPAFAGFDELLRGLVHVRAFGMEERYQDQFYARVDKFQSFDHVYWLVNGWLGWRYDCLGSVVVFMTTLAALWRGVSDGAAAIVIVQAGIFAEASRQLVRVAAQLELDFNSVERIVEYVDVPQEAPAIIEKSRPPAYWPSSSGGLVVEDLVVRYAADLPPAINGISFEARPAEKIGVVGRTGSGKSTLAMSLLRVVEPSNGRVLIDGIDITKIGLEDLRTRVTIVSQDVSLFSGSIRSNLDPLEEHTDQECWDVLERCHLKDLLAKRAGHQEGAEAVGLTLDLPISQAGSLSAGERQLLALSRAVLRRPNVIIMDEATSQIDTALDDQIQKTIRQELSGALIITIAHRLKTIMDYDRVLVLGFGEILEFGPPAELLKKQGGAFREMCRKSADWDLLRRIVE
ncbi:P-loop containing nucleoside triphosphate hydrolase protein [Pterulicium gracile]|uniref:P-loop containing nucleoside triphosphate hydrolase protein n=1 Tax=Pterulicium gracile TaxID=1884261 RepID=A0A5C3QQ29_9AGAR|nr:P-loop containing nucleoside triphosphate hydrolase protein [Pterula gracilis]